jgi:hypothetical protein
MTAMYEPVAFRVGNPARLRGLISRIKLLARRHHDRDGDILEQVLRDYAEILEGKREQPSMKKGTPSAPSSSIHTADGDEPVVG